MLKTNANTYEPEAAGEPKRTDTQQTNLKTDKASSKTDFGEDFLEHMPDVVCLSHLRWNFVYQRPQHLLSRFAKSGRVFFVEEPVYTDTPNPYLHVATNADNVQVVLPHLPHGLDAKQTEEAQQNLLNVFFKEQDLERYLFWYYTPMALAFTAHFKPVLTVYDCMDELAAFKFASPRLKELEQELFKKADLVFTGGQSLYEAKKEQHAQVYAFPSSIDKAHFGQARQELLQPQDQASIPHPRIGFFGVIDERLDIDLLGAVAAARPAWQLIIIGPVVKIDPAILPQYQNIHYLGGKAYQELPAYLSGWDVAILPFAINESTRFISPTKTPEYLAAGKPVVSTPIRDVVRPYGDAHLVHIAHTADEFVEATEQALAQADDEKWKKEVDIFLADMSWDQTWRQMVELMGKALYQHKN
ncbi:glycosyltransferase family 1 protein [Pontibacter sp. 172403-2]|uniref:glycosyltransferase family 1 protein n=1 Tax=Pontibacter rufus TaxID=2791028 RepID=UPI0018AFDFD9|nr:glycosyltransferase family 1 protein [Pontibacter sp. 172403-2]MBF9254471.1 glycosyltransferase family 1 protein [Pontibacter sp. 172403-2]